MGESLVFNAKDTSTQYESVEFEDGTVVRKKRKSSVREGYTRRTRIYSEEKTAEMREAYSKVVVHDFNDEYHMSEEERKLKFTYYEAFAKIRKCKRKYRKLDDFVKVYRLCLDCLDIVAENNGVYPVDEFIKRVVRGKIEVYGLVFPKYVGRDKKNINWEYVSEYIADRSRDPSELVRAESESEYDFYDPEDIDKAVNRYFGEGFDVSNFIDDDENEVQWTPEEMARDIDDWKEGNIVKPADTDMKVFLNLSPQFASVLKDYRKRTRSNNQYMSSFSYNVTREDFDLIERMDRERNIYFDTQEPEFKGNLLNDDDYNLYMYQLEEYGRNHIKVNHNGKLRSQSEIDELDMKDALEKGGWNVRAFYHNDDKKKKLKKAYKEGRQKERDLKKRLLEYDGKKCKKDEVEFNSKSKKKKKQKFNDKKREIEESYQQAMKEQFDDILMDTISNNNYRDFKEYKDDIEDFSFSEIFGK